MNDIQTAQKHFALLDSFPVGGCILREDFAVLFWNRQLEDWTNIPRNKILGTNITVRFPHLSQSKYTARLRQIFEGGPPTIFSSQLHKHIIPAPLSTGQLRIQQTTVTSVPGTVDGESYALLVIEDVTDLTRRIQDYRSMRDQAWEEIKERQRVEEALRASEEQYRRIVETVIGGIWVIDADSKTTFVNNQMAAMLGYIPDEMIDRPFFAFMDEQSQAFARTNIERRRQGIKEQHDFKFRRRDGSDLWTIVSSTPIFESAGQYSGALKIITDISDRKRTEEALRQQTEREKLMRTITQHIHESLNLDEILTTTVTEVREFLQTDRVIIYRFYPDWSGTITVESVAPGWTSILGMRIADPCFRESLIQPYQHGCIRAMEDIDMAGLAQCYKDLLAPFQVRANLVVPILFSSQLSAARSSQMEFNLGVGSKHLQQPNSLILCSNSIGSSSVVGSQEPEFIHPPSYILHPADHPAPILWGLLIAHHCREPRRWQPFEIDLLQQLATQVAIAIQQAELYEQLQTANQELQRLAAFDGLTQVANRRRFDEYLNQEWRRLGREALPLALILCDIDCFKLYNDTYGHQAGDECLQQVAKAISRAIKRPADLVARYGGEEFAVILPNTDAEGAVRVAEDIRVRVKALQIDHAVAGNFVNPPEDYLTMSLGVASTVPGRESSTASLIAAADRALYQAKAKGRNRVQVFQPLPSAAEALRD